ncbi:uncharacterized protein LOC133395133 [Anopheles gambiae]|uniref:uncharacterized protein LOC133395133 n=1 Tax=Anopheles gambiae TaxID=7165 RepID=UPI002AC8DFE0|nr:uncharacterized protein LOC133395133 [Anopheles gambiae]
MGTQVPSPSPVMTKPAAGTDQLEPMDTRSPVSSGPESDEETLSAYSSADETDVLDDGIVQDERLEPQIPYAGVSMENGLRNWAFETNQTQRSVTLLLRHLRQFPPFNNLPSDARTLLKPPASTSQDEKEISSIAGGQFWYQGIEKCLQSYFP